MSGLPCLGSATNDPLSKRLAEGRAVVAGGAALFGTVFYVVGSVARDTEWGREIDPLRWAERGAQIGGTFGLTLLIFRALNLH